jgi:DNA-binding transcriptional regulator YiaG
VRLSLIQLTAFRDAWTRDQAVPTFRQQMAQSTGELQAIMTAGQSPSADGRLTVRTIEVTEPGDYDAAAVRRARDAMGVSQAIFARLGGVSDVLVRSWERGVRQPAPVVRRRLDQMAAQPKQFTRLIQRTEDANVTARRRTARRVPAPARRGGSSDASTCGVPSTAVADLRSMMQNECRAQRSVHFVGSPPK